MGAGAADPARLCHCEQPALLPRLGCLEKGDMTPFPLLGCGEGRLPLSPGPIQTLLHTLITDRDKALSNLTVGLKDNEEHRGKIISSGE